MPFSMDYLMVSLLKYSWTLLGSLSTPRGVYVIPFLIPILSSFQGGVNAGFNDSEALLAQPQEVAGHTPVVLSVTHEGNLAPPDHDDPVRTDSIGQDGRGGSIITTDCENELSRLSCLAVPHIDIPPVEYQPPPSQ